MAHRAEALVAAPRYVPPASNALILGLSYSWIGLGAYAVTSMLLALRITAKTDGPKPSRSAGHETDATPD